MRVFLIVAMAVCAAAPASAQRLTPAPGGAVTGYSGLTQSYVYAPPDEGSFTAELQIGAGPHEFAIETPEACAGRATVTIRYSKSRNKVWMDAEFTGLPYRPSYTRASDPSTPWVQHLQTVEDGRWQIWIVGALFVKDVIYYYDAVTTDLVCNEIDCPTPPPGTIPVPIPGAHLLGSPIFEGKPNGKAKVHFEFAYDHMVDGDGTGGNLTGFVPERLCEPDHYTAYYSATPLPPEQGLNFDDVLEGIHKGAGVIFGTSLEPYPKPAFLHSRDNIMLLHYGQYPAELPRGYTIDLRGPTVQLKPKTECGVSHEMPEWPSYYHFCPAP